LSYTRGDITAIDGKPMTPGEIMLKLNSLGGENGIGRADIVENRYVGMKSRGAYETPGGTIMLKGHRAIESLTLDREVAHLKDDLMPRYASLIYNGYWWSPERRMLQEMIDVSQENVNGVVRLKLYKRSQIRQRQPVRRQHRYLRSRRRRLQPERRRGLYQTECPAHAHCSNAPPQIIRRSGAVRVGI